MTIKDITAGVADTHLNAPAKGTYHPLDPVSAPEITAAVAAIKAAIKEQEKGEHKLWFKSIQLNEPPKRILAPWLDKWHANGGQGLERLPRRATALLGVKRPDSTTWYEFTVNLDNNSIESATQTPTHLHVPPDMSEMLAAEKALLEHPEFIKAIEKLQLPKGATVVADGWIYGADDYERQNRYTPFMVYANMTGNPDVCHYSAPLPLVPVMSSDDFSLVRIDYTPIFGTGEKTILDLDGPFPWDVYVPNEYDPDLVALETPLRTDVKPYRVVQPEGASFSVSGRVLKWQKWSLHISFNYREGLVLNDVRYDGRKLFYRMSVSDMTVPYGDPRAPFHRKQAFDLGDVGAGLTANQLQLGCDCLGEIMYLDFDHLDVSGKNLGMKGVVCIHEQDDGIGWKHTNYRTNKAAVVRSRVLILQTILTVANYEYIFAWKLDQSAGIHLETRATGILSTATILPGETSPYGNVVSPGVLGTNHQHIFCVRIDPQIDGDNNTVVQEDSVPMAYDKTNPPEDNRWGVGYVVEKTPITTAGFADAAPHKNRVFKITNPNKLNPVSGKPVSYKLVPAPSQLMLAHPDSVQYARAEFGEHHLYVTQHRDQELYAGGKWTNQSYGNAEGMRTWVGRGDNTDNDDVVVWHSFGLTHNPRTEDFPIMPCETHMISLKPNDFFSKNPSIDVPPSTQAFNQSKLYTNGDHGNHMQGSAAVEAGASVNNGNGSCCA